MTLINGILELKDSVLSRSNYNKRMLRHVTAPLPSCLDCVENRVLLAFERLLPHDTAVIEGVQVTKTTHSTRKAFVYFVGSNPQALTFAQAVAAVVEQAGREAGE